MASIAPISYQTFLRLRAAEVTSLQLVHLRATDEYAFFPKSIPHPPSWKIYHGKWSALERIPQFENLEQLALLADGDADLGAPVGNLLRQGFLPLLKGEKPSQLSFSITRQLFQVENQIGGRLIYLTDTDLKLYVLKRTANAHARNRSLLIKSTTIAALLSTPAAGNETAEKLMLGEDTALVSLKGGRDHNEDCVLVSEDERLLLLADGMGGHSSGEFASRLAVSKVSEKDAEGMPLVEAIRFASEAIRQAAASDQFMAGMGTTLVAAKIEGDLARIAHVGDSRAYRNLSPLTKDHRGAGSHVIERALGHKNAEPDLTETPLEEGDRLLLCSDGLTDALESDELLSILAQKLDLEDTAKQLIAKALQSEKLKDNVSFVIYEHKRGERKRRAETIRKIGELNAIMRALDPADPRYARAREAMNALLPGLQKK